MRIESNILLKGLLRLLNLQEASSYAAMLVVDAAGTVRKASQPSVPAFQLAGIVSNTLGVISMSDHIGLTTGSFTVRIELTFGDLNHAGFRLSAGRSIEFSMLSYAAGASILHTEPVLMLQHHSGTIVRLSDHAVFDLSAEDIEVETLLVNNLLRITIRNRLQHSVIPAANAAIKCRYSLTIKRFVWDNNPEPPID